MLIPFFNLGKLNNAAFFYCGKTLFQSSMKTILWGKKDKRKFRKQCLIEMLFFKTFTNTKISNLRCLNK